MTIDYKAIGKRIRIARIKSAITQEILAEKVSLSPTHISNIETGNTKLSLPTIIHIANALSVSVDELLCDNIICAKAVFKQELKDIVDDCSEYEIRFLVDMLYATKNALRKNTCFKQKMKEFE